MVAIMAHLHQYAPMVESVEEVHVTSIDKTVQVTSACARPILVGGDQLTAARARGAQKAKVNALTPRSRLEGLVPMVEDWHTKVTLLTVGYNYYFRNQCCTIITIYFYRHKNAARKFLYMSSKIIRGNSFLSV